MLRLYGACGQGERAGLREHGTSVYGIIQRVDGERDDCSER